MNTILTAIAVTILDQVAKWFVQGHMELGESIPLISHVFHLTYIMNPGAAFGILEYQHTFFLGIVVILFAAYLIMRRRIPKNPVYFPIGIGMVLGGALGNAIDRVRYQGVVDFFDFRVWPIFNVADIAICVGMALILWYFWRHSD
jgi:signal peptidase II